MEPITPQDVQRVLEALKDRDLHLHLEMTTGAYASHLDSAKFTASTFMTNAIVRYTRGTIAGSGPYRVGLKTTNNGWVYSEGLTHWEYDAGGERLLLAGHDAEGKLVVGLQLGREPF
ncbi:YojF family protein [Paenibacillus flagellatus]|uniref:DUF1806 domain-containing protein n=1 Tax=Paenibacillus flagellatus TaxID=2211139 RepID=A0A2V5JY60_9BACL|nr:YojF family protein [Paenibacillus flagellatus]PYI51805.1 DUF1806 domain-containing protein [Paenibacillus flagellatus]